MKTSNSAPDCAHVTTVTEKDGSRGYRYCDQQPVAQYGTVTLCTEHGEGAA